MIGRALALSVVLLASAAQTARADEPPKAAPAPKLVPPKQLSAKAVPYPEGATGDAEVIVQLVVGKDGTVESVTVVEGEEPFAAAARVAAAEFRFEPATADGVPVRATIRARITFHPPVVAEPDPPVAPPPLKEPEKPKPTLPPPVDLVVEGERREAGQTTLGGGEVRILPGAFGDPFRAIEALPGVTPLISGLPFFYVRGSPPGNTGYLIDGIRVPMLFHLGAGPSVLAPGLIDRVDFHPGGYPARYGRFTGGIVAGETVGPASKLRGEWNVRLFDASAMVETPLKDGRADALVAGRYGYPGLILSLVSPETSLQYWDYQLRAGYRTSERDRFSVFFFGAFDKLRDTERDTTLFDAQFHRGDLRWDRTIEGGHLRVATTLMFDQSGVGEENDRGDRFAVRMLGWGARAELDKKFDKVVTFRGGADVWLESYRLINRETGGDGDDQGNLFPTRADVMTGLRGDFILKPTDRVEIVPGVRFDVFSQGRTTVPAVDPRLATRLRVARKVWTVTTLGVTHQTPSFLIPFPGLRIATLNKGLQEAFQMAQGVEIELPFKTRATATVFHNAFRRLSDGLAVCANDNDNDQCDDFDVRVPGRSYGLELLIKRDLTQRIGGWLAYTLSRSERTIGGRTLLSDFDRTHVLSLAMSANLGKGYRAGGRFSYLTGRPATLSYVLPTPRGEDGERFSGMFAERRRLPDFHRLDLRLEKRWTGSHSSIAVVLEWFNVYFQKEATDWQCDVRLNRVPGEANPTPTVRCAANEIGPITIPSIGVEGQF